MSFVQVGGGVTKCWKPDLFHFEAGVLHHVPHHGHDLGRELPLLLSEGGAGRTGVLQPVGKEHVVGRHMGKQGQPRVQGLGCHFCTFCISL